MSMTIIDRIKKSVNNIIYTGTHGIVDQELATRITLVNTLSLALVILIVSVGIIYYSLTSQLSILLPASIEAILAVSPIFFNHYKKYNVASLITFFTQCLASLYFGLLLGNVIELQAMVIFLFLITFLIFKDEMIRRICIGTSMFILLVLEVSYYNNLVTLIPLDHTTAVIFKALSVVGVMLLILIVGRPYVKSNDELHKANHFKKMYVYQVTHEMRTPLNAIYGVAQLIKREIKLDAHLKKIAPLVDHLLTASDNARHIINNVLDMAQIELGKTESVSIEAFELTPFISKIIEVNKIIARSRNIKIHLLVEDMPAVVIGDTLKLNQVITNLLANAIKYANKNSTVNVRVKCNMDKWQMQFMNQGSPIPAEKLNSIFEPFVTNKNKYTEGTGLGLYIVKNKVNSMNGTISAESSTAGDVCFTLNLPLKTGTMEDIIPEETGESTGQDLSNIHVLIAEDNELNAKLLTLFFNSTGCTVTITSNGLEVLEEIKKNIPDIIIMDYHMEVMDGEETLKVLKSTPAYKNIPVIIATGDIYAESQKALMIAGANAIIEKPINHKDLLTIMNQHVHHYDEELQE
ncbi:signal transduction histidine kinase [Chitinophaga niastensis]|uniref:histidine kinase n=1 Tax=Chitinophaga niastensis TaxID=536980 RepID=A0A2P8HPT7_CHINA|nr:hybrid sensor histidine kinase/response regulator [Chitinophaga niastensis]PSL48238.1 signal transduction histidine kinase [Chitinophaga niastensis]